MSGYGTDTIEFLPRLHPMKTLYDPPDRTRLKLSKTYLYNKAEQNENKQTSNNNNNNKVFVCDWLMCADDPYTMRMGLMMMSMTMCSCV